MGRAKAVRLMAAQSDCDMLSICIYFHEINVGCYEFCSQENGSHCSLRAVALNDNVEELNPIKISESSIKTCSLITCWSHLALLRSANLNLQGEIKWKPEWLTLTSSLLHFCFWVETWYCGMRGAHEVKCASKRLSCSVMANVLYLLH